MQRKNLFFGAGAVLVAAGAIGTGVMVSSNAMAASSSVGDHALTISMVSVGTNGDAYQCTFDAAAVPGLSIAPLPASAGGTAILASGGAGTMSSGAIEVSGSGVIQVAPNGSMPPGLQPLPAGAGAGVITLTGSATADGSSSVSQIAADGTVTPVNIRQGTTAECAAAQQGVPPAGAQGGVGVISAATPDTVAADPKG
jgi:hypothetical protein